MATVRVTHTLAGLRRDLNTIARTTKPKMARVVKRNTTQGERTMKRIARASAGPHGSNYFKRISSELIDPLTGEIGPEGDVAGNAVGASWRNGPPNTDSEKTLDIQGPKFRKDAGDVLDGAFWP